MPNPTPVFSGDWVDLVQAATREGARSVAWNDAKGETRSFCVFWEPWFQGMGHLGQYPQIAISVDWCKHEWKEFQTH